MLCIPSSELQPLPDKGSWGQLNTNLYKKDELRMEALKATYGETWHSEKLILLKLPDKVSFHLVRERQITVGL